MAKEKPGSLPEKPLSPEELEAKLKKEYQDAIAAAVLAAQTYNGSKQTYESLIDSLSYLDEIIRTIPDLKGDLLEDKDMNAAIRFTPGEERDMSDIIKIASASLRAALQKSLEEQKEDGPLPSSFRVHHLPGIVLAPRTEKMPIMTGEGGRPFEKPHFDQQLSRLIKVLEGMNIFADDVLITVGDVNPKSWREESYVVVEIPELNRTVLVCDQFGEASYVIRQLIPARDVFTTEDQIGPQKQTLSDRYGAENVILVRRGEGWSDGIRAALGFNEIEIAVPRRKVDMAAYEREDARQIILKKLPTVEDWIRASGQQEKFEAGGLKIGALRRLFGVKNVQGDKEYYLTLGEQIYGVSEVITREKAKLEQRRRTEKRTKEEWRTILLARFPAPRRWMSESVGIQEDGTFLEEDGVGIWAIAVGCGFEALGKSRRRVAGEVAAWLYGNDHPYIKKLQEQEGQDRLTVGWKAETLKTRLHEEYPTKESWTNIIEQEEPFFFHGATLKTVCTLFDIPCSGDRDTIALIQLARTIHGSCKEFDERRSAIVKRWEQETESRSAEEWKARLREEYPKAEDWIEMTVIEKRGRFDGATLTIIGKKVGLEQKRPTTLSWKEFIMLGIKIYGNESVLMEELEKEEKRIDERQQSESWTQDEWKKRIQAEISPEQWVALKGKDARTRFIGGRSIANLGSLFAMTRQNMTVTINRLRLGQVIYGEDNEIIKQAIEKYERENTSAK